MGRSYWRRMTSYRGCRKWKLCQHKVGEDFRMFKAGNKSGLGLTEDDMIYGIATNVAWGVKRQKADGLVVTEEERKEECLEASKYIVPRGIPSPATNQGPRPRVILVFKKASLVLAKTNKTYQIIHPDEHAGFMQKHNLNRSDYRPDIVHEVLKRLLGSCINLAGGIQAVYVKTIQGHLIKIEPTLCVPRTLKGFCGMMLSGFPVSASLRVRCICNALERQRKIL